ncbi:MAG: glycosyltransferase [Hyphomicrobiaceae bacterium]|nr:MAG: glycosyltransferase [Hyphomicrobiaceae bacterium]
MIVTDLLIIGPTGGTHIAGSFARAAGELGLSHELHDTSPAYQGPRLARSLVWRLGGKKPYRLNDFSLGVGQLIASRRFRRLLAVGQAPIKADVLAWARAKGIECLVFATDDPFNPAHRADWFLDSLPQYDRVFTPRRANIIDLQSIGCRAVDYLPFGFDPSLFPAGASKENGSTAGKVLFVGGADQDRIAFMTSFIEAGGSPELAGAYWDRHETMKLFAVGSKLPEELCRLTASAAVNLCLVRRANRDGHVMRSFEIPAVGGFLLAEDTAEHREIFGEEGTAALYFATATEAAEKAKWAIAHPAERAAMARAAHHLITSGGNTYKDRLSAMLRLVKA